MNILVVNNGEPGEQNSYENLMALPHTKGVRPEELPRWAHTADVFLLSGGPGNVNDTDVQRRLGDQAEIVHQIGKLALGACLGSQRAALHYGGTVEYIGLERGVHEVEVLRQHGVVQPVNGNRLATYKDHEFASQGIPGSTVLARRGGRVEAFQRGHVLGVQYHPEHPEAIKNGDRTLENFLAYASRVLGKPLPGRVLQ
ncbi:MAG: hypothetical protein OXR66_08530 [Candidatus Woesearchaeota archaeon]|nr:hypothetical protein [Candidatus Woesearchaeota archaeon]